jgi:Transposase DDE domain
MDTESRTITPEVQKAIETCQPVVDDDWQEMSSRIPIDIETLARETKALQRKREVKSALDLLRLALAYSICDWSLRLVGAWATVIGLGSLSDVATRKRLRRCQAWLGRIIGAWLQQRRLALPRRLTTLRLVDASSGSRPGSRGTDWRLHVTFDLATFSVTGAEVTDVKGGETLARHPAAAGEIFIGDRGYGHRRGLGTVLAAWAYVLVRTNGHNLPLEREDGQPFDLLPWLQSESDPSPREVQVWLSTPLGRFELRLVAQPLPKEAAEKARRRAQATSRKKGHTPSQLSLVAAGFVLLVTNLPLPEWTTEQVAALYRLRWQVELLFKRLKGVLDLDALRAKEPVLTQVYLLGKIVGWLMIEDWSLKLPSDLAGWFEDVTRPVSLWRWTQLWTDVLRQAIRGSISLKRIRAALPDLARYLRDAPRKRRQQAASIRHWLNAFAIPAELFHTVDCHESALA